MKHFLSATAPGVDQGLKAGFQPLLFGQSGCKRQHPAEQLLMFRPAIRERWNMDLGDEHEMHTCEGVDVVKSQNFIVFIHFLARHLPGNNLAENALAHDFLDAFSSFPEMPSRRASSFSTSCTLN